MAALNSWLTFVPVVSDEPEWNGVRGTLAEALDRQGDWREHDVLLSGSPAMTRATLARLRELGVPDHRVAFDVMGDVHPAAAQVIDLRRTRARRAQPSARR
jgi:NAD(P)H-flavin reductase